MVGRRKGVYLMYVTMTIPGKPIAKKRPRFFRRDIGVGTYNDQDTEEGKFMLLLTQQWPYSLPIEKDIPIEIKLNFFMPIPKSTSKKRAALMRDGNIRHTKKPDTDNLIKFVKDCMNSVVWADDSQVWFVAGKKLYADNPRTEIEVMF